MSTAENLLSMFAASAAGLLFGLLIGMAEIIFLEHL
jgi:hypothetical protein